MDKVPYKLPEGWRWVKLGEVVTFERRAKKPADLQPELPFVGMEHVEPDTGIVDIAKCPPVSSVTSQVYLYNQNHVLYGKLRPYLNKVYLPEEEGACSTEFVPLRPNPSYVDRRFLAWYLRSSGFVSYANAHTTGARQPRVDLRALVAASLPLPPLSEQRRIVARIEELMERIREARRLREEARQDTERLWQAVLAETFPHPGSELPEGWRWVRLGEVCETKMGGTPSTKVAEYWEPPEIVWVTPEDLEKSELNRVFSSRRLISRIGLERSSAKLFPPKTVLLSTTATIGKVAIAEKPLSANQQITGIICGDNVDPQFLAYYLIKLGETGLKQFGGTATATHINQTKLRSLSLPLPPLSEQRRIVAHLEAAQEHIQVLKEKQAATEAELKRLEQAILEKAFRGEL